MLGKLLKYDFKTMANYMIPVYLIVLVLGLLSRLGDILAEYVVIFRSVTAIITLLFVISLFALMMFTFALAIYRFYTNFVKDEGYLTHTLPVSKNQLLLSKLISSTTYYLLTSVVIAIGIAIAFYNKASFDVIWNHLDVLIRTQFHVSAGAVLGIMGIMFVISYIYQLLLVYLAIALGQTRTGNRILNSILFGFILYIINQVVSMFVLVITAFFQPNFWKQLETTVPDTQVLGLVMGISIGVSVLISIVYYIISVKILDKKLNLE